MVTTSRTAALDSRLRGNDEDGGVGIARGLLPPQRPPSAFCSSSFDIFDRPAMSRVFARS
jgi:hypothetical protein